MAFRCRAGALALGVLALAGGCRSASERFHDFASDRSLRAEVVTGTTFRHLVLSPERAAGRTPAGATLLLGMLAVQVALGIATLLYVVPLPLAALHQAGAVITFALALNVAHALR